jgi:hypothetical protein
MKYPFDNLLSGRARLARPDGRRPFPAKGDLYTPFLHCWQEWLCSLYKPTVGMYRVALAIQLAAYMQRTTSPRLSNNILGVDRQSKYRALKRLAKAGMVRVEQQPGQAPIVHLVMRRPDQPVRS